MSRGARVDVVPWDFSPRPGDYDGLFLSNGPGDPRTPASTLDTIRAALGAQQRVKPIFGICLGHQLLAVAAGCHTYKLK